MQSITQVLIVGGSIVPSAPECLCSLAKTHTHVLAVDRGLDTLLSAGLTCDAFCGDLDSVSKQAAQLVQRCEAGQDAAISYVERYNPYKDQTDLSLAIDVANKLWPKSSLTFTCVSGGKPDHALAVYGCLASIGRGVAIVEDGYTAHVLPAGCTWTLNNSSGARFSCVPLTPQATVSETGMQWELEHHSVELLSDLGISNCITSDTATITCHEGTVIAWCFDEKSPLA